MVVQEFADVVTVPIQAVHRSAADYLVYVLDENGDIETRPIQPGYSDRLNVIVESGLEAGEKVVVHSPVER